MREVKKAPPAKRVKKPNILLRILTLGTTAALVLGALALVVYRDAFDLAALKRWMTYRSMPTSESGESAPFTHAGGDKLSIAYLDSGAVTASAAGAHYYGLDGVTLAEEVLSMESPVLSASRTTAVAYDAGGQALFSFRDGEERFSLSLEGGADLLSARPNDSGWLAVTAQQSGYKGAVTVYNDRGKEVIQISLSSTFAVDAVLSPDCKTAAVVTMGQTGGDFFSRLLLYPVDQEEPSVQIDLGSIVVLDLDYEEDLLWILGEDRLIAASPDGQDVRIYPFGTSYLKGCSLGGDGFAMLLTGRYRSGDADQVLIVDGSGQAVQSIQLTSQVLDYAAAGGHCALLTGSRLTLLDRDLSPAATLENLQSARKVALSGNGSALLANDQQAWLFIP